MSNIDSLSPQLVLPQLVVPQCVLFAAPEASAESRRLYSLRRVNRHPFIRVSYGSGA